MALWSNISISLRTLNHQMIGYIIIVLENFLFTQEIISGESHTILLKGALGTFLHMTEEHPEVLNFWKCVSPWLSVIMKCITLFSPLVLLLNIDSLLRFSFHQGQVWLAGLMEAKKLITLRWQDLQSLQRQQWSQWVARLHGAKQNKCFRWCRMKFTSSTIMHYLSASPVV